MFRTLRAWYFTLRPVVTSRGPGDAVSTVPVYVDARHLTLEPTGVGVWLRSIVGEWDAAADPIILLARREVEAPGGRRTTAVSAPSALWHLVAAWRTWRSRGRYLSPDSFLVPLLVGRRATLVVHDLTPILLPGAHTRRSRLSHALLLRLAVRRVGAVVVPSRATADDLLGVEPAVADRLHVIAEAARPLPSTGASSGADATPYVLYVGTIEPRKNVDVLVRAFRDAAPAGWRLVLAGKLGWLSEEERTALVREIDADDRIEHLGYVSDEQLGTLYRDAEVFVYASSHEGFGLPVLEAMSHGVATITSDADALAEVAGDAAICVPLADLEAGLTAAIERLTASEDDRRAYAEAGRRRAQAFSWASAADALLQRVRA